MLKVKGNNRAEWLVRRVVCAISFSLADYGEFEEPDSRFIVQYKRS